jgi:hypothetical protein
MKKNSTLDSRLAKYSAVAGAVVTTGAVNAQVMYTDVTPDATANVSTPYALDFNGDATTDLTFVVSNVSGTFSYAGYPGSYNGNIAAIIPVGTNEIVGGLTTLSLFSSSVVDPVAMNAGDPIINTATTFNAGSGIFGYNVVIQLPAFSVTTTYQGGNWLGVNDKFVGAKFMAGANTHYGWVRISVAADATTITVKEYAYNAAPNGAITAGQTTSGGTGLDEVSLENKVTFKNQFNQVSVNVTPDLIGGQIMITDMTGRKVADANINDVNTIIGFEGMATGVYNVVAQFDGGVITHKIYVR